MSGITLTKLIGMSVLALTRSKLLEVRTDSTFQDDATDSAADLLLPDVAYPNYLWSIAWARPATRRIKQSRWSRIPSTGSGRGMDVERHQA